jgi:hypothetical protein
MERAEEDLMSPQDDVTRDSAQSYSGQYEYRLETPFLETFTTVSEGFGAAEEHMAVRGWDERYVPFAEVQEAFEGYGAAGSEDLVELLAELEHPGFNDAVNRLVNEASEMYQEQFAVAPDGPGRAPVEPEQMLEAHFQPLVRATEGLLDEMSQEVGRYDVAAMSEAEFENLFNRYEPPRDQLPPNHEFFMENFLGKLKKLAKGALNLAKKGIGAVAKVALGPILAKLKGLVQPLLRQVLKFALNKLPAPLRPLAQQLAGRLPFLKEDSEQEAFEAEAFGEGEDPAAPDPTRIQAEFDAQVANLLFAGEEAEQELVVAQYAAETQQPAPDAVGELDRARAEFIYEVSRMESGDDPALARQMENFLPLAAVYPIAKGAIAIIGRQKVINFIAGLVAQLIGRYVGQENAKVLSGHLVGLGLGAIGLEAPPEERAEVPARAIAATVEETMRRLPGLLSEDELEDRELLEGAVLEAFEGAAAACLPAALLKPRLREAMSLNGAWVFWPARARRYRCKKYTLVPEVRITPQIAREVRVFGGIPLARILRDKYGLSPDRSVDARLHLYEAIPGATVSEISRSDRGQVSGLGTYAELLQPLTPEAATAFLQEPGLGREVSAEFFDSSDQLAVGQRLYYLEVPAARPQMAPTGNGTPPATRRTSGIRLEVDFPRNQIRVYAYLSEVASQEIASMLRQRAPVGAVLSRLKAEYASDLKAALSGGLNRRVKLIHEALPADQFLGLSAAIKRVHPKYLMGLRRRLQGWLRKRLAEYLQQQGQKFISTTEDPADGVTLIVTFTNPAGLPNLRQIVGGASTAAGGASLKGMPETSIEAVPGYAGG